LFVKFAAKEMGLTSLPKIHFVGNKENKYNAFGHSIGNEIHIRVTDRHPGDIMRTIAHELLHFKQNCSGKSGKQFREDEANAVAGRIMRKFNTTYPSLFKLKPIAPSEIKESESLGAANSTGEGIANFDPLLGKKAVIKRKLNDIIGSKAMRKELRRDR
jgi:hypothetical protein